MKWYWGHTRGQEIASVRFPGQLSVFLIVHEKLYPCVPEDSQGPLYLIIPHWKWSSSGSCRTWVCFLPPKADKSYFSFILCKLENERSHLGSGRCILCFCMQGEPHINVFLMCLSHVQGHREGKRGGLAGDWVHLPSFALIEVAFLEHAFWNFEQTNFLCPQELILVTIPFQRKFSNMGDLTVKIVPCIHSISFFLGYPGQSVRSDSITGWGKKAKPKR